jgi:hypothetical protein
MAKKKNKYTVKSGDSWARIAGRVYGDQRMFAALMRANRGILVLRPGMVIDLPEPQANPYVGPADIERAQLNDALVGYKGDISQLEDLQQPTQPAPLTPPPVTGPQPTLPTSGGLLQGFNIPTAQGPQAAQQQPQGPSPFPTRPNQPTMLGPLNPFQNQINLPPLQGPQPAPTIKGRQRAGGELQRGPKPAPVETQPKPFQVIAPFLSEFYKNLRDFLANRWGTSPKNLFSEPIRPQPPRPPSPSTRPSPYDERSRFATGGLRLLHEFLDVFDSVQAGQRDVEISELWLERMRRMGWIKKIVQDELPPPTDLPFSGFPDGYRKYRSGGGGGGGGVPTISFPRRRGGAARTQRFAGFGLVSWRI